MQCPERKSTHIRKNGHRRGKQNHICVDCGRQFIDDYTCLRGYSDEVKRGCCNRDLFELWLEQCLLPQLQPGDAIVIDNASFHHSQSIEDMVAAAGCEFWYLPPYSPDLNKIERWWFVLKNWMRQRWDEFDSFRECVDAAFNQCPNVLP